MKQKRQTRRFLELDLIRGFAILFMIFLHILWDLDYFGIIPLDQSIYRLNILAPALFFTLVGVCLVVSTNKKPLELPKIKHLCIRGSWVLFLGFLLTLATLIALPDRPIFFGVLHCIGLCIILSIPFLKYRIKPFYTLSLSFLIILAGYYLGNHFINDPSLTHLIIGAHQQNVYHYTVDYFPLIPWFGVCLFGISLGNILYKDHKRQFHIPDLTRYKPISLFSWMGQHSLVIYMLHQPVIAGFISAYLLF